MNNLYSIIKNHNLHPVSYEQKGKATIVSTKDRKYVIKLKTNNYDIYQYLKTRSFNYFPNFYNIKNDNYDLLDYIEDTDIPDIQRIEDLINVIGILHKSTSYYEDIDLDELKKDYENIKNNLLFLRDYYHKINNNLDNVIFLSPSAYLLIRNISLIYYLIDYALNKIDEWYLLVKDCKTLRFSLIHNNISKDHILINTYKYLISWDKSKNDYPIYDLISIYKKYYSYLCLNDFFNLYAKNNILEDYEICILMVYLATPEKITFSDNVLQDVVLITKQIAYLKKIYEYIKLNKSYTN